MEEWENLKPTEDGEDTSEAQVGIEKNGVVQHDLISACGTRKASALKKVTF